CADREHGGDGRGSAGSRRKYHRRRLADPWFGRHAIRYGLDAQTAKKRRTRYAFADPAGSRNEGGGSGRRDGRGLERRSRRQISRGGNCHYRWVPLECLRQVDRLRAIVMRSAPKIACQTLVVHAREDELTSLRSANFLVEKIGGARARMVVLEDSYHMVCVDN